MIRSFEDVIGGLIEVREKICMDFPKTGIVGIWWNRAWHLERSILLGLKPSPADCGLKLIYLIRTYDQSVRLLKCDCYNELLRVKTHHKYYRVNEYSEIINW